MNSHKTVITFANQLAVLVVNVLALKATLAALSPDDYGLYGYALSLTGLFMVFTELSLSSVYFKRIAEGQPIQQHYSTYVTLRLLLVAAATLFFVLYAGCSSPPLIASGRHFAVFATTLAYYGFDAVMLAVMGAYQAQRDVKKTQVATALMALVNLLFIVCFVVTTGSVWLLSIALVVKPVVGILCFARLMKGELQVFRLGVHRETVRDYYRFVLPLLPMSILAAVYDRIDGTLVTAFLSLRDNGFLAAATMFNTLLLVPSTALITLLYSLFSEEIRNNDYRRVQEISNKATKYLSMLVSPAAMFFFFYAEGVVTIAMSKEYLPAVPIMQVFMFQVVLMSVSRTFGSILVAAEKLKLVSAVGIGSYLLGIALDFVLIPDRLLGFPMANLGATGPAYKSLIVYFLSIVVMGTILYHTLRITIYWRFIYHILAAFSAGVVVSSLLPGGNSIAGLILPFAFFGSVYLVFLILLRELKRSDAEYLLHTLAVWRLGKGST